MTTGTELKSDRRVIKVAVVDCDTNPVGDGTTDVEAEGFVEMFVVSTWQVIDDVHQIYTEIIGPIEQGIDVWPPRSSFSFTSEVDGARRAASPPLLLLANSRSSEHPASSSA